MNCVVKCVSSFVVVAVFCALPVAAQTPSPQEPVPRRVVIHLDEDVIEASPRRPDTLPVVSGGRRRTHESLIRIRTDFRQEVLASVSRL